MTSGELRSAGRTAFHAPENVRGTLGTVRNAVLLLDLLSEGPAYRQLSELAAQSGLSVPTVHRLLRSLVLAELVEQQPRTSRYGLGPEVIRLSQRYLTRLPSLGALAPYLVPLRDHFRATVQVALLVGGTVVYVDRVDGDDCGLFRETMQSPGAFDSASGRVLVCRAAEDAWEAARAVSAPQDHEQVDAQRAEWRDADHLLLGQELAVPVFDRSGDAVAALSMTVAKPEDSSELALKVSHLLRAAAAAGRTLGNG